MFDQYGTPQREEDSLPVHYYSVGVMYDNAEGFPRDLEKAAQWYEKAAEENYGQAQHNLADMFYNGDGVPQDHREATARRIRLAFPDTRPAPQRR